MLSIVIPVFNAEAYVCDCLSALLCQASEEVEIVVVDDGSQDNTKALIEQRFYEQLTTESLVLISQPNQGVSAARNLGIQHARGRYIGFVDGDDLVQPHYFTCLLTAIEEDTDIIEFGFKTFINTLDETKQQPAMYSNTLFGRHAIQRVQTKVYTISRWYPWTRIYKKTLFRDVQFPVGVRFCEDVMTIPNLYENASTIVVLPDALYAYRVNPNSATFQVKPDYVENIVRHYRTIPYSGQARHDYLRISFAYTIISCQKKSDNDWQLPQFIQEDMNRLRWRLPLYWQINFRVMAMLLYPTVFKFFASMLVGFRHGT